MFKQLKKNFKSPHFVGGLFIGLGVLGLIISTSIYASEPKPPSKASGVNVVSAPSSVKLPQKTIASYSVPPTNPKYIAIPAIGINNTPVVELGLLKNGAIGTPGNIFETGWYDGSVRPGQIGAMFIYGHVSSWTADGIFYNLKKLSPGDKITITRGDNTTYTYEVVSTKIYPYNNVNMNEVLSPITPNTAGLNLMTCTGQVISGTSEFNERLVVFSKLVN